jgi:hypothetical protein
MRFKIGDKVTMYGYFKDDTDEDYNGEIGVITELPVMKTFETYIVKFDEQIYDIHQYLLYEEEMELVE